MESASPEHERYNPPFPQRFASHTLRVRNATGASPTQPPATLPQAVTAVLRGCDQGLACPYMRSLERSPGGTLPPAGSDLRQLFLAFISLFLGVTKQKPILMGGMRRKFHDTLSKNLFLVLDVSFNSCDNRLCSDWESCGKGGKGPRRVVALVASKRERLRQARNSVTGIWQEVLPGGNLTRNFLDTVKEIRYHANWFYGSFRRLMGGQDNMGR